MSPTKKTEGFSAEEKAAMRARAKELKLAAEGEEAIQAALKKMTPADRALGKRIHAIVQKTAPDLTPKTWYGMPAYANKDGKVVCFFQSAQKFDARYATLGFSDQANLDERGHVADLLRAGGVGCHRRGEDRGAREEGGEPSRLLLSPALRLASPRPRRRTSAYSPECVE